MARVILLGVLLLAPVLAFESGQPTVEPMTTTKPKTATRSIPDVTISVPCDVCSARNLSLMILIDASKSINDDSYEMSKNWAKQLLQETASTFEKWNENLKSDGFDDANLCLRAAVWTFSYELKLVFDLEAFGDCYDVELGNAILDASGRPHDSRLSGTHLKEVLQQNMDNVLPQARDSDARLLIVATDGLPNSVYGGTAQQNPCLNAPNQLSFGYAHVEKVRTVVVVVESLKCISNTHPFECLFSDLFSTKQSLFCMSAADLYLPTISPSIHSKLFEDKCELRCVDFVLFPHETFPNSTTPRKEYETEDILLYAHSSVAYRFTVNEKLGFAQRLDIAQLKLKHECADSSGLKLRARLWLAQPLTLVLESNEALPTVDKSTVIHDFEFPDVEANRMYSGETYILEIEVESESNDATYVLPTVVTTSETSPFSHQNFTDITSAIAFEIFPSDVPPTWNTPDFPPPRPLKHNNPLVALCITPISADNNQDSDD